MSPPGCLGSLALSTKDLNKSKAEGGKKASYTEPSEPGGERAGGGGKGSGAEGRGVGGQGVHILAGIEEKACPTKGLGLILTPPPQIFGPSYDTEFVVRVKSSMNICHSISASLSS